MSRKSNYLASLRYELETDFPFPIVECVVTIIIFAAVASAFTGALRYVYVFQTYNDTEYGTWMAQEILRRNADHTSTVLAMSTLRVTQVLAFLIPVLVASGLAKSIEDGTLQTMLTYPVPMRRVLMFKTTIPLLLTVVPAFVAVALTAALIMPTTPIPLGVIPLALATLCAYVVMAVGLTALMAVVLRRALPTALGGIMLWFTVSVLGESWAIPTTAIGVMNPVVALYRAITYAASSGGVGENIGVVTAAASVSIMSLIMGAVLLGLTYRLLMKRGVTA